LQYMRSSDILPGNESDVFAACDTIYSTAIVNSATRASVLV